jgi:uncharacterized repeat protein (TIGR03803 family)
MKISAPKTITRLSVAVLFLVLPYGVAQSGNAALQTLYSFTGQNGDGILPYGTLVISSNGRLYGTTIEGGRGGGGTVFELTPPGMADGTWNETILHSFGGENGGPDGASPNAGLVFGDHGELYGTTVSGGPYPNNGRVFEVTPPSSLAQPGSRLCSIIFWEGRTEQTPVRVS